jgi:penicillin-binding protein 1C
MQTGKITHILTKLFLSAALLFLLFIILDSIFPLDIQRLNKPVSTAIYDKDHRLLRLKLSSDGFWRFRAQKEELPKLLKESVIAFEDRYFYHHFGINPFSIFRAIYHNATNRRIIGASTITMQVARMMYQRERTLTNKLVEIFNALQLEWHFSKEEILTHYFNLAPYGGNIEGVKSAAIFYFQKPLHELTISQIAILTSIPKNPNRNRPTRQKNLTKLRNRILTSLKHEKIITEEQLLRARKEPIRATLLKLPFHAPHFTNKIKITKSEIETTLDLDLQRFTLSRLKIQLEKLKDFNLHNAAALVIHNPTMQIVAYVGSANFFDTQHAGQNNGVTMIRSPGSTLKPFIYLRALEMGYITPNQQLYDSDLFLQGYRPKNFSKRYTGRISAKEALQYSLNIPAIMLNHILGKHALYELLKTAEITSLDHPKNYYGDAIALGGFGISLLDLTRLYSALANKGILKELNYTKLEHKRENIPLFSKEAAYLISEILSDVPRNRLGAYWESTKDLPKVAFKTGTSASSKDLLTIGYTPEYTAGVWFGNFNGEKTKNLTGRKSASEVVLDIFAYLNKRERLSWFEKPKKIITKKRCVDAIETQKCKTYIEDSLIEGITPSPPCRLIRPETVAFLIESREITDLSDLKNNPCYETWRAYNPVITTPDDQITIRQNSALPPQLNKIKLNCYSFEENQTIYWFIDHQKPLVSISGKPIYRYLKPGQHTIGCLDRAAKLQVHTITIKE